MWNRTYLDTQVMADQTPQVLRKQIGNGVTDGRSIGGQHAQAFWSSSEEDREHDPGCEEGPCHGLDQRLALALWNGVV